MSNIYDEDEDWQALAEKIKKKIKDRKRNKNEDDGEWCVACQNFSRMSVKNFGEHFLCFGCNTHRNRMIFFGME